MRRRRRALALPLLLGLALLPVRSLAAEEPVLERVLLSTGGVGYLGYRAAAGDDGVVRLRVPLRQVDDVLKSLTVLDAGAGGRVGAVSLLGPTPLADVFRDAPFGEGDLADLPTLLGRLRGAELEVRGPATLRGRLLAVAREETAGPEGTSSVRHRLSLLTEEGIRSAILENVDAVALASPELKDRVGRVLGRLADGQLERERELAIALDGAAGQEIRLGYLAEMPLWKASYRLVAAAGAGGEGLLQGWAILENPGGQDWRDVEVTLAAGSPTALRQALFRSYLVPRPEVPVLPEAGPGPSLRAAPEPAFAAPPLAGDEERSRAAAAPAALAEAPALDQAQPRELTAQTLFRLARKVSLPAGHTAMAPLVDRPVPIERVVLYQAGAGARHPQAALRLRNPGDASLPAGLATLFERVLPAGGIAGGGLTYLGDAPLPAMPPGAVELLGYGLDANVDVDRREATQLRLERARVVDGVLELTRVERRRDLYVFTARFAGPAPRRLVLAQPLEAGWRVAEPADAVVEGAAVRVERDLAPASTLELALVAERPVGERVALADAGEERLRLLATGGDLPPEVRAALERLGTLSAEVAAVDRRIGEAEARRAERVGEQERLRANLQAVPPESDLARRYLDRMGASEDELAALARETEELRAERERSAQARRDYLRSLRI